MEYERDVQREQVVSAYAQPGAGKPADNKLDPVLSTRRKPPVVFKVILDSKDAINTAFDEWRFNVDLPWHDQTEMRLNEGVLSVQDWWVNVDSNMSLGTYAYHVSIPEVVNRRSFHSSTRGVSDVLFTTRGYSYQPGESYRGIPVSDNILTGKILTVKVTSATAHDLAGIWSNVTNRWTLSLNITFPVDE